MGVPALRIVSSLEDVCLYNQDGTLAATIGMVNGTVEWPDVIICEDRIYYYDDPSGHYYRAKTFNHDTKVWGA